MKKKYHHQKIEAKWRSYWKETGAFRAANDSTKPKYYVLDMFPYPSGAGLHVGHAIGYTATDIVARFKRQNGFNVLHPIGWDSFGLPAEQYAVRTGTHPAITTKKNISTYKDQLQALGYSYDWEREIATSSPDYYKWTQWIFTLLLERGLAYQAEMMVNWCSELGTVLANEEVAGGLSVEGGHPVERRPLRQWMLKITAYADRLLDDLEKLDWPEHIKKLQAQWIGRSEGAEVVWERENGRQVATFTTRPDTLLGVTFVVLAPEHPLVNKLTTDLYRADVEAYVEQAARKSDFDRTETAKDKSGVFTGGYAVHPVTKEQIPVWIADYVLPTYGTGAVMAVPSDDERDREFAEKYDLPVGSIEGAHDGFSSESIHAATEWLVNSGKGSRKVHFRLRDWLFSRQRYWGEPVPVLHLEDGTIRALGVDELPLCPPEVADYKPADDGQSPLAKVTDWVQITDPKTGMKAERETNTMPNWAGSCWYYLRFCDPNNDQKFCGEANEKYWMPIDLYIGGAEHAVLHLLYARFWHKVLFDCGLVSHDEPIKRLFNQGLVLHESYKTTGGRYVDVHTAVKREGKVFDPESGEELNVQMEKMSKSKLNSVNPNEIVEEFGADAVRCYAMFLGPLDKEKIWNSDAVSGCYRFLQRFYNLCTSEKLSDDTSDEALRLGHRTVDAIERGIETLHLNTCIAKMMEFVNDFSKLEIYPREVLTMMTQALAPFAPHLAEELWEILGHKPLISNTPWPKINQKYLEVDQITYIVQVNGKLRGRFDLPKDQPEEVIVDLAKSNPQISKHLTSDIRKVIFVPNKLINFVI